MTKKALLIEDDKQVRYSIASILTQEGFDVVEAENGIEGIEKFKECDVNIIFCDIIMPGKDGLSTISGIRELSKETPIVAISGGGRVDKKDYLTIAHNLGATHTIEKPFNVDDVLSVLKSAK